MHPLQKPIISYLRQMDISDENYESFLKYAKTDLSIHDLCTRIKSIFGNHPIGLTIQLMDAIQTRQSNEIKKAIVDRINIGAGWDESIGYTIEKYKWLRQPPELIKALRKIEFEKREREIERSEIENNQIIEMGNLS